MDETGKNVPVGFPARARKRPRLIANEGDLALLVQDTLTVLKTTNDPPWLFRSGDQVTWIVRDDTGAAVPKAVGEDALRYQLAKIADWKKKEKKGSKERFASAHPPATVVKAILTMPNADLPILAGVTTTPVFGPNGKLLTQAGYHPDTRLFYVPQPDFSLRAVPEAPTQFQIERARALLVDELLGDFPFKGKSERAHAVGMLLVFFVRSLIKGPTPLHMIEKPAPGTGATLLVDAIAMIATGTGIGVMVEGRNEDEWRKRLTAKLRQFPSLVLIDNIRQPLDSSSLSAALTAPFWEDRVLQSSDMVHAPIRCIWMATGNNPVFSTEMARRLVRIRLDARVNRPSHRKNFKHPNLIGWVKANRAELVAACLTLCQAWIAAGMLRGSNVFGSFEEWAIITGGILQVAGIPGFLENANETIDTSDGESKVWTVFIGEWWERHHTREVGVADLYQIALEADPPPPLGDGSERSQQTKLGNAIRVIRDRIYEIGSLKLRVASAGVRHQAQQWKLVVFVDRPEWERRDDDTRRSHPSSQDQIFDGQAEWEPGEPGEPFLKY